MTHVLSNEHEALPDVLRDARFHGLLALGFADCLAISRNLF